MTDLTYAEGLAKRLPVTDPESNSDFISLADIVVTGVETPWTHFGVLFYDHTADGVSRPWVTLVGLAEAGLGPIQCDMYASTVRKAVQSYLQDRLDHGMDVIEAARMIDGSYTDALVADSILQFAIYGKEVFA